MAAAAHGAAARARGPLSQSSGGRASASTVGGGSRSRVSSVSRQVREATVTPGAPAFSGHRNPGALPGTHTPATRVRLGDVCRMAGGRGGGTSSGIAAAASRAFDGGSGFGVRGHSCVCRQRCRQGTAVVRVLITGGAGFIGSHLAEALLGAGDEVDIIDNLSTGSIRNVEHLK